MQDRIDALIRNVERVIRGKRKAIELSVVCLVAKGHLLIEDVPGVGKTTLASSLARSLGCSFRRIQFTSDLLPSDLLGVSVFDRESGAFRFREGPIFHQIVLADEINRATPRTQSALLEAMSEGQVSLDHNTHDLPEPFLVIATQNPTEYRGTFPLPESQLDRFWMRISIGYPGPEAEREIVASRVAPADLDTVVSEEEIISLQSQASRIPVDSAIVDYIQSIVAATRVSPAVTVGVSPRAAQALYRSAQASALVEGEAQVLPRHVKDLAVPVLAHRLQLRGETVSDLAQEEGVLASILDEVPVPL